MRSFIDILGDEWNISINLGEMRRMEERAKFYNLGVAVTAPEDVITRIQDPFALADLLFVAVEPQAEERGIGSKEFGFRLAGDVIAAAKKAFTEEYADFFPNESQRAKVRALAKSADRIGQEVLSRSIDRRETALDEIKDRVIREIEELTDKAVSGVGSGNSAASSASSESTPTG